MKMSSSNRGQLRPHFGGRSPPFLVAALCVGLGILGISYYSLSSQYASMESALVTALHKVDLVDKESENLQSQLNSKSDEYDQAKLDIEKKDSDIQSLKKELELKTSSFDELNLKIKTLEEKLVLDQKVLSSATELQAALDIAKKTEASLRQEIEDLKKTNNDLQAQLNSKNSVKKVDEVSKGDIPYPKDDVPVDDASFKSKFNIDTDNEPGEKPKVQVAEQNPVMAEKDVQSNNKSDSVVPKAEDKVQTAGDNVNDTNISGEIRGDENPAVKAAAEEEMSNDIDHRAEPPKETADMEGDNEPNFNLQNQIVNPDK